MIGRGVRAAGALAGATEQLQSRRPCLERWASSPPPDLLKQQLLKPPARDSHPLPPCAPPDQQGFLESRRLLSPVTLVPHPRTWRTSSVACPRLLKVFVLREVEVSLACLGRLTSPGSMCERTQESGAFEISCWFLGFSSCISKLYLEESHQIIC